MSAPPPAKLRNPYGETLYPGKYGWVDFDCDQCGRRIIADAMDPRCPKCDRDSTNHEGSES